MKILRGIVIYLNKKSKTNKIQLKINKLWSQKKAKQSDSQWTHCLKRLVSEKKSEEEHIQHVHTFTHWVNPNPTVGGSTPVWVQEKFLLSVSVLPRDFIYTMQRFHYADSKARQSAQERSKSHILLFIVLKSLFYYHWYFQHYGQTVPLH